MKKILAGIIALTTVFCTFTSCGSTEDEKAGTTSSSVEETVDSKDNSEQYEKVVNEYIDAINSKDIKRVFELQMPDGCMDVVKLMILAQYEDSDEEVDIDKKIDEYLESTLGDMPTLKLNKIVSIEDLSDDETDSLKEAFASYILISDYIEKQGGINNVDFEKMEEEFEDIDPSENIDSVNLDGAKFVTFEALEEGSEEPVEEEYYIYRINGGEWHIDNSMLAYVRKAKKASANTAASSLMKAANTALVEMDEEGKLPKLKGALVCSDDSKNINVPDDFDTSTFKKKLNNYFNDEEKFDWFVVINEKSTVYAVAVEKGKSQIGTYPGNSILKSDMDTQNDDRIGSKSFDEVYDMCADVLK